uniref:Peptidase S74 domain-containing protein n=1 Tax=viral metagenome TaxID=1070528 RepID=A0A6C0HF52_9ZZZZ
MSYQSANPFITNIVPLFNVTNSPGGPSSTTSNYSSQINGFQKMLNYNTNTLNADNINGLTGKIVTINSDIYLNGSLVSNGFNMGTNNFGSNITNCYNFNVSTPTASMNIGSATEFNPGIRFYTNNIEAFYIDYQGNAFFSGTITSKGTQTYSDERLKTNIVSLSDSVGLVSQLRGVQFIKDNISTIGFIAQEVNTILPNIVNTSNAYWSVDYLQVIPLLVESIKELSSRINSIEKILETRITRGGN